MGVYMYIHEPNGDKHFEVKGGSMNNLKESIHVLPTRRILLEAPKEEDGNAIEGGFQGGIDDSSV